MPYIYSYMSALRRRRRQAPCDDPTSSPAGGQFDRVLVVDGVLAPVEALLHPLVVLPPRHLHLLPLLPPLGEALALQHPDHLGHGRAVLGRRLRAEQRDLDHHLHLLPVVTAVQVAVDDGVEMPFPLQLLDLQICSRIISVLPREISCDVYIYTCIKTLEAPHHTLEMTGSGNSYERSNCRSDRNLLTWSSNNTSSSSSRREKSMAR
jgi:hypothetical protein